MTLNIITQIEHSNGVMTLNNQYTYIQSLTLRDYPLFAMSSNMFTLNEDLQPKYIDIDETSLINPSMITQFKIEGKQLKYILIWILTN